MEQAWTNFLVELDRVWVKVELVCKAHPKFAPWQGQHRRRRKRDPLLRYLTQARDSGEHTLGDLTAQVPGGIGIGAKPGTTVHIKRLVINATGPGQVEIEGDRPENLMISLTPNQIELLDVSNRSGRHKVPRSHLGTPIVEPTPLAVGELGLAYWRSFAEEAEVKFLAP